MSQSLQKTCKSCQAAFTVTEADLKFYDQISPVFAGKKYLIPAPMLCSQCRLRRRLAYRCHTALFTRQDIYGKSILSMYPPTAPFPVIANDDYFTDTRDPLSLGQDIDWQHGFFEQFFKLNERVPKYARISIRNDNCDYCNNVSNNKDLYLVFATSNAEQCMYGENVWGSRDCLECTNVLQSEACYDCTACFRCYNLQRSEFSENCSDSYFLSNCKSCRDCFGCVNLRNKQFCIWNEQKTEPEYRAFMAAFNGSSWQEQRRLQQQFVEFTKQHPRPHATFVQTEASSGNFLTQCHNVTESSFIQEGENLKYCLQLYEGATDCMDQSFFGRKCELLYECCSCGINVFQLAFCIQGRDSSSNLLYCYSCDSCKDCFGCISLHKKQYCIFNKQYTKEQYEVLVPKLIKQMQQAGEWGEFFPLQQSPIPYNRSLAQRYFPMTRTEIERQHLAWYEEDSREFPEAIPAANLPDRLPTTNDPLVVLSALSGRPFRITTQEIEQLRRFQAPLPRLAYEERMDTRANIIGGIKLYQRACAKTGKTLLTTYPPNSPYIIWDKAEYDRVFQ